MVYYTKQNKKTVRHQPVIIFRIKFKSVTHSEKCQPWISLQQQHHTMQQRLITIPISAHLAHQ